MGKLRHWGQLAVVVASRPAPNLRLAVVVAVTRPLPFCWLPSTSEWGKTRHHHSADSPHATGEGKIVLLICRCLLTGGMTGGGNDATPIPLTCQCL
jgi:hypothetical protein